MKTNHRWTGLSLIVALLLAWGQLPAMATPVEVDVEMEVEAGFEAVATSDLKSKKVGEYEVMDEGIHPTIGFSLTGNKDDDYLGLGGFFLDDEEQGYYLDADFRRKVRQSFEYDRFQHWLDHDPLDNLNAVYSPGDPHVVTHHTDYDADAEYNLIHSEIKSTTEVALPFLPGGQFTFNYRKEKRDGYRQSLTMSKCTSCHVQSHSRSIDEVTEDYVPSIKAKFGDAGSRQLALEYSFLYREFDEDGATPTNLYDEAVNPRKIGSKPFGDRVWYENEELAYDNVPEMEKILHKVKAEGSVPDMNTSLYAAYINSNVENENEGLEVDTDSASVRISNRSIPGLVLQAGFRWMEIDNEDYLVDYELPTGANPNYSGTYEDFYGPSGTGPNDPAFVWPYNRESALSRDDYRADLKARYNVRPGLSVHGSYQWRKIDRDSYMAGEDETDTEMDTYKVGVNGRWGALKGRVRYTFQDIDEEFVNSTASEQGGACEAFGTQETTGNWRLGEQYYQFWTTRTQDMSNQPDERHEVLANLTYPIKHNLTLTGNYRWVDEDTTSGDGQLNMPSISLWYTPHPKLSFMFSYLYDDEQRESRLCMPVFNG
jgi:hypothetical protein